MFIIIAYSVVSGCWFYTRASFEHAVVLWSLTTCLGVPTGKTKLNSIALFSYSPCIPFLDIGKMFCHLISILSQYAFLEASLKAGNILLHLPFFTSYSVPWRMLLYMKKLASHYSYGLTTYLPRSWHSVECTIVLAKSWSSTVCTSMILGNVLFELLHLIKEICAKSWSNTICIFVRRKHAGCWLIYIRTWEIQYTTIFNLVSLAGK